MSDPQLEIFTDEAGVAVLKFPAGFELGILGFDRLDAGDGFVQKRIGVDRLSNRARDQPLHHRIAHQRQNDKQGTVLSVTRVSTGLINNKMKM